MARKNVLVPTVTQEQLGSISDIAATHQCNLSAACTRKSRVFMWGHLRNQPTPCAVETQFRTVDEVFACFASPAVSPRAISFLEMTQSPLLLSIRNAFNDPTHCDMKIIVEGKAIHVHKALLKIRCQYFRVRLGELWHDSNENTLEVKDFPYNVYKAFLHWLYTDELNVDLEEALGLLELATCYCEENLKDLVADQLVNEICIENVCLLYSAAVKFEAKSLEMHCYDFCVNHMSAIFSQSLNLIDETALRKLIGQAAKEGLFKR